MAKKKFICCVCGKEFIANKNTNIKTCPEHRGNRSTFFRQSIYRKNLKSARDLINNQFKYSRVFNTSGTFQLGTKKCREILGHKSSDMYKFESYATWIKDRISDLQHDLEKVRKLINENKLD
jgi:hypothetical protein